MTDSLTAIIKLGVLTPMPDTHLVPALIAMAGEQAGWRYVEFFTALCRFRTRLLTAIRLSPDLVGRSIMVIREREYLGRLDGLL